MSSVCAKYPTYRQNIPPKDFSEISESFASTSAEIRVKYSGNEPSLPHRRGIPSSSRDIAFTSKPSDSRDYRILSGWAQGLPSRLGHRRSGQFAHDPAKRANDPSFAFSSSRRRASRAIRMSSKNRLEVLFMSFCRLGASPAVSVYAFTAIMNACVLPEKISSVVKS